MESSITDMLVELQGMLPLKFLHVVLNSPYVETVEMKLGKYDVCYEDNCILFTTSDKNAVIPRDAVQKIKEFFNPIYAFEQALMDLREPFVKAVRLQEYPPDFCIKENPTPVTQIEFRVQPKLITLDVAHNGRYFLTPEQYNYWYQYVNNYTCAANH